MSTGRLRTPRPTPTRHRRILASRRNAPDAHTATSCVARGRFTRDGLARARPCHEGCAHCGALRRSSRSHVHAHRHLSTEDCHRPRSDACPSSNLRQQRAPCATYCLDFGGRERIERRGWQNGSNRRPPHDPPGSTRPVPSRFSSHPGRRVAVAAWPAIERQISWRTTTVEVHDRRA